MTGGPSGKAETPKVNHHHRYFILRKMGRCRLQKVAERLQVAKEEAKPHWHQQPFPGGTEAQFVVHTPCRQVVLQVKERYRLHPSIEEVSAERTHAQGREAPVAVFV